MKNYSVYVGVDISKSTLDFCWFNVDTPNQISHCKIDNTPRAIAKLLKTLGAQQVVFCMEDTGVYGMLLYKSLSALKLDYAVVPALKIKRSKGLVRGKSDKSDAKDIAIYACTHLHDLELSHLMEPDLQELNLLLSEREKLVKAIKLFEATKESTCYIDKDICKQLRKSNEKTVKLLEKQLLLIEQSIKALTDHNNKMKEQMALLQSIPGIGPQTALQLIAFTKCFSRFKNWRQLACYAGVAPFPYQSGSSIKGRTKVSHYAQKKLKSTLHIAALTTKKYDVEIKNYYERKVAEGKNKMLIINNIRCKLLSRIFAIINRNTPYVNLQKFAA